MNKACVYIYSQTHFQRTSSSQLQSSVFPRSAKVLPHVWVARKLHTGNMLFPHCLSHNLWTLPQRENVVLSCVALLRSRRTEVRNVLHIRDSEELFVTGTMLMVAGGEREAKHQLAAQRRNADVRFLLSSYPCAGEETARHQRCCL